MHKDEFKEWFLTYYEPDEFQNCSLIRIMMYYTHRYGIPEFIPIETYLEWFEEWGFDIDNTEHRVYTKRIKDTPFI